MTEKNNSNMLIHTIIICVLFALFVGSSIEVKKLDTIIEYQKQYSEIIDTNHYTIIWEQIDTTTDIVTTDPGTSSNTDVTTKRVAAVDLTDADIDLLARVVMSEAGSESYDCKVAIAQVVLNRVVNKDYPNSVSGVVYQKDQFSTHNNGKPNKQCYDAVMDAINEPIYPFDMLYFRANKYHNFGYPYISIDNTYFSTRTYYE